MSRTLAPLTLAATLMGGTALAEAPSVAVDIAPVHALVARVMDGVGAPDLVIQPGASPHAYSLRPSEAKAVQDADLVFWIGPDLTPWLTEALETLAGDAAVTTLMEADGTIELPFREGALFEAHDHEAHDDDDHDEHKHDDHEGEDHAKDAKDDHKDHDHGDKDHAEADHDDHKDHDHDKEHADHEGHDDHKDHDEEDHADHEGHDDHKDHDEEDHADHEGHDHGDHDPHAWLSPQNAMTWLNVIAGQLSAADPDNAGAYFANAAAGRSELEALVTELSATLEPLRGGKFVVFHDAYQYFENAFDFPASGAISLSDASEPSPARIAEIQGRIAEQNISCVLAEPQFNPKLVQTVMDGTQAKTGLLDPLGSDLTPGADLYPQLLRNLTTALVGCLER